MRKIRTVAFAISVAVALIPVSTSAEEDEQVARARISTQAATLLAAKNFVALNNLASTYRITGARTPSGIWKLSLFYLGLRKPLGSNADEARWRATFQNAETWVRTCPSPAAHIALANLHIGHAWQLRGTGVAKAVSAEKWQPFFSELNAADRILANDKKASSIDPQWYAEMIEVAREKQWTRVNSKVLWLEAVNQHRYYNDIYNQIMQSLEPLWRGDWRSMENFANFAAKQTRDRLGEEMYTRVYWHISDGCGCSIIGGTLASWDKLKAGFQDIVHRYPTVWNRSAFGYFACLAKDKATLKSLLQGSSYPALPQWAENAAFYNGCRKWALGG